MTLKIQDVENFEYPREFLNKNFPFLYLKEIESYFQIQMMGNLKNATFWPVIFYLQPMEQAYLSAKHRIL